MSLHPCSIYLKTNLKNQKRAKHIQITSTLNVIYVELCVEASSTAKQKKPKNKYQIHQFRSSCLKFGHDRKFDWIPRQLLASVPQWGQKENPGCLASCTLALTCKVAISNLWPPRPGSLHIFPIPATIVSIPLSSFRGEFKPNLKFSFPSLNLENRHSSRRMFPPVLLTFLCHHLLTLPALSAYHHPTIFLPSFLPPT